ncbi:F-box protein [Raphanus sativus]|uniref:F-box protein At1g53790-like n=1 Tax=Raphanus sativus TaxID=3726 RepID=A0A6J0KA96_RAPSA|nr:F-box protein At1g53790-like [Raphanus sativus]KAJ4885234.1 F-box protein [Raphanus sativus]
MKLKQLESVDNLTISTSTTQSSIPVDLLIDIFSRVPSKSIARFLCLSKSWASIFSRPYFTELFLTKSSSYPRLLFTTEVYDKLLLFSAPQTQNLGPKSSVVARPYQTHSSNLEITSSLHGLICCQVKSGDYTTPVICNPATGEFLRLPKLKRDEQMQTPMIYCGYDPTDKKFKMLSISDNFNTSQARVLTLGTGKHLWRKIKCIPHNPVVSQDHMICIDGVLYYLAYADFEPMEYVIVSFDVKSEKFSFINIDNERTRLGSTLINYKGKLGLVHFTDYNGKTLRLWLLEDGGTNKWSSSIHELPLPGTHPYTNKYQIVGMTRTCDIVLSPHLFSDPFYVLYYNVERKTLARIEIQGLQELKCYGATIYTFHDYFEDLQLMKCL